MNKTIGRADEASAMIRIPWLRAAVTGAVIAGLSVLAVAGSGYLHDMAYAISIVLSAIIVCSVAIRHPFQQRAWMLIGIGLLCWALAALGVTLMQDEGLMAIPMTAINVLYISGYVPMLIGLVMLGGVSRNQRTVGNVLDGLLMFVMLYAGLWLAVVDMSFIESELPFVDRALSSLYPAGDLALVMLAVRLVVGRLVPARVGVSLLLGLMLAGAADVMLLVFYLNNPDGILVVSDLVYLLGCGAIAVAAILAPTVPATREVVDRVASRLPVAVGVAALSLVTAMFVVMVLLDRPLSMEPLASWLVVVVLLTVVRSIVGLGDQRRLEKQLEWYASHDSLTGLLQRWPFVEEAQRGSVRDRGGTVMHIDIDQCGQIARRHGHEATDLLLAEVARRLRVALPEPALLCRLSHDEFAAFARSAAVGRARSLAESVRSELCRPYTIGGDRLEITVSIGVSQADGAVIDVVSGMRRAHQALVHVKQDGPGRIGVDADLTGEMPHEDRFESRWADRVPTAAYGRT